VYSNGISEIMIGKTIKKFNLPRQKLVILSKCFGTVGEEPAVLHIKYPQMKNSKDYVNQGGLSRQAILSAVDASLERLQTPYIDLLQIHRFDATVPVEETMKALHDLVEQGKVRYIGASSMWAYQFAKMQNAAEKNGWTKFVSMQVSPSFHVRQNQPDTPANQPQNHYSLCYREEEREMNPYCAETGVGLIPWAPLYRGLLARPPKSSVTEREKSMQGNPMFKQAEDPDVQEIISRTHELAEKKGWKMSQVALAWIVQKGTIPICGFSNLDRLDEAVGVRGKTLSEEEMKYLEEPYLPKKIVGH
jgi:aryl-alcohol dehydrogenase-like predicted oxidoreductase